MSDICTALAIMAVAMNVWLVMASYVAWRRARMVAFSVDMMGVAVMSSGVVLAYIYDRNGVMMSLLAGSVLWALVGNKVSGAVHPDEWRAMSKSIPLLSWWDLMLMRHIPYKNGKLVK